MKDFVYALMTIAAVMLLMMPLSVHALDVFISPDISGCISTD